MRRKLGIQVASGAGAKAAPTLGADYLVCQGIEAGGHVQASQPLVDALEEVLSVASTLPVLVAGGIATGHDIKENAFAWRSWDREMTQAGQPSRA